VDVALGVELSPLRKVSRFSEARLQAVSSRNMYSEQGFEARIGPSAGQVCQALIVSWNCMLVGAGPGGVADLVPELAGLHGLGDLAVVRRTSSQSASSRTARRRRR
jgi:hypothetical protein